MVPEGWNNSTVAACVETIMGYAFSSKDFVPNGIPLIRMGNLYQNQLNLDRNPVSLPFDYLNKYSRFVVRSGDLVMSMTGTRGKRDYGFTVRIPDGNARCLLNQRVMKFSPNQFSDDGFILYLLLSEHFLNKFYSLPGGTKQANLSAAQVKGIEFLCPPLPEQRKIAEILSTWDRAIEVSEALLATARTQKRALMQALLTGKRRFPEFEGQEWKEARIGDVAFEVSVRNKSDYAHTVISCTKSIGFVNSLDYFKKQVFSDDLTGYKMIKRNQIGYPSNHIEEGSIGIQNLHDIALVSPIYTVFETTPDIDPVFLFRVLKTDRYRQIFAAATNASVDRRGSLRWKAFSTIRVPSPSLEEQLRINGALDVADMEISKFTDNVQHLRTEKKALMQQLLTGKRRVTV